MSDVYEFEKRWSDEEGASMALVPSQRYADVCAERDRLRAALGKLRAWDMLSDGSWLGDAAYFRTLIDEALEGPS